jgi:SAM-dependent methyltransferase
MALTQCTVCGSSALVPFIRRDGVPVHQNHPVPTRDAARAVARGDLHLDFCTACGFIFNVEFDEAKLAFGELYVADQTWSPAYDQHVASLVDQLIASGIRRKRVVEIGCGTGDFLKRLCERGENYGFGYDPAYLGPETAVDGRITFVRKLFDANTRPPEADLVICRHVLAHVPRPFELLRQVRRAIGKRPAPLFIETAALEWTLDHIVVQDFYYEYCSYHSEHSMRTAAHRAGFEVASISRLFGGQYMWVEARPTDVATASISTDPGDLPARVEHFRQERQREIERWAELIARARREGPVCIWGVGAKGVTFLNLLDCNAELIAFAVDRNPRKQGRFVAGTGHPIASPDALRGSDIRSVLVMNDHYREEIRAEIDRLGINPRLYP